MVRSNAGSGEAPGGRLSRVDRVHFSDLVPDSYNWIVAHHYQDQFTATGWNDNGWYLLRVL